LSVFGEGQQTRSFCYVDDLVRGIVGLLLIDSDKTVEERKDKKYLFARDEDLNEPSVHDPVNIGNPRELTVLEIARLVLKLTGSSSDITFHPLPLDDPKVRRPDITRAKALLKWEPQVALEDALGRTIRTSSPCSNMNRNNEERRHALTLRKSPLYPVAPQRLRRGA
jgi:nucleoside-diphosphate-sugar epimerase